jgi:hypothetical protein
LKVVYPIAHGFKVLVNLRVALTKSLFKFSAPIFELGYFGLENLRVAIVFVETGAHLGAGKKEIEEPR